MYKPQIFNEETKKSITMITLRIQSITNSTCPEIEQLVALTMAIGASFAVEEIEKCVRSGRSEERGTIH